MKILRREREFGPDRRIDVGEAGVQLVLTTRTLLVTPCVL